MSTTIHTKGLLDGTKMTDVEDMKIDASRAAALVSQVKGVSERIAAVSKGRNVSGIFWDYL